MLHVKHKKVIILQQEKWSKLYQQRNWFADIYTF